MSCAPCQKILVAGDQRLWYKDKGLSKTLLVCLLNEAMKCMSNFLDGLKRSKIGFLEYLIKI